MAALFTLLLGVCALLLGYFLYDFGRQNFIRETEAAINSEMKNTLLVLDQKNHADIEGYIAQKAARQPHPIYLYISPQGEVVAGNITKLPENVERIEEGIIGFSTPLDGKETNLAAKIHTFDDGYQLLIARDVSAIEASYSKLKWLSGVIILFMLIVVMVSFFISIFVVTRINLIARTANRIMSTGDLSKRISIQGNWDDLSHLAQVLNAMFARIETLMVGVRDVSDSIAHDLRTPLMRLRQQLEQGQGKNISTKERELLIKEADDILETFQSLLRIANIEKAKRHSSFEEVNLLEVMQDVIELYEPLMEDKRIQHMLHAASDMHISGDKHLLFQLFANVLDNAVKFSPKDSMITIKLLQVQGRVVVAIADEGCGLTEQEKENVYQRFYRADKSRHTAGSGLGLSLVKAIVELHRAEIALKDNAPGLIVEISFQH